MCSVQITEIINRYHCDEQKKIKNRKSWAMEALVYWGFKLQYLQAATGGPLTFNPLCARAAVTCALTSYFLTNWDISLRFNVHVTNNDFLFVLPHPVCVKNMNRTLQWMHVNRSLRLLTLCLPFASLNCFNWPHCIVYSCVTARNTK